MLKYLLLLLAFSMFGLAQAAKEMPMSRTPNDPSLKWGPCPDIFPQGCQISVLHGDPAKPETDVYLKFPSKYSVPAHSHTSPEHMTLVSGELKVQYEGQEPVIAKPGTYLYGPSKAPHKATCQSSTDCVLFISFDSKIDAVKTKEF